ncbi:hypothetical protein VitviT2T_021334 [Vitis vinifera]|uniref:Uncharacterized protein n=1 Tax=Vitis vinifera TaxID=29760 RepID=A0ABY9D8S4_VITVI|nr:hypothetical protein VitviT2T_021334 [Vitis vinifera]
MVDITDQGTQQRTSGAPAHQRPSGALAAHQQRQNSTALPATPNRRCERRLNVDATVLPVVSEGRCKWRLQRHCNCVSNTPENGASKGASNGTLTTSE